MLDYKRERTEFSEEAHTFARELTEAVNSYLNDIKGDEIKETLDIGMIIGSMLMSGNRQDNVDKLVDGIILFAINTGKASLEEDNISE